MNYSLENGHCGEQTLAWALYMRICSSPLGIQSCSSNGGISPRSFRGCSSHGHVKEATEFFPVPCFTLAAILESSVWIRHLVSALQCDSHTGRKGEDYQVATIFESTKFVSSSVKARPPSSLPTVTFVPELTVATPAKLTNPGNVPRRHFP